MAPVQLRETRPDAAGPDPNPDHAGAALSAPRPPAPAEADVTLLELLDRALDKGVVLTGDITLSVANVDLVYVGLRLLLTSVETMRREMEGGGNTDAEGAG